MAAMMTEHTTDRAETMVRWFSWFGWDSEKVEKWLESKAAAGWHLVKAGRLLNRFHFKKGDPKTIRVCADYPGQIDSDYMVIAEDAGWEMAAAGLSWYIWRAEYHADKPPEAFNDPEALIDRNRRLITVLGVVVAAMIAQVPIQMMLLNTITRRVFASGFGKALLVFYALILVVGVLGIGAALTQIRKLKATKL